MSWSVSFVGTPTKIREALEEYGSKLSGQSKEEFEEAAPCLQELVRQNYRQGQENLVKLEASGHGSTLEHQQYRTCRVQIEPVAGQLLI